MSYRVPAAKTLPASGQTGNIIIVINRQMNHHFRPLKTCSGGREYGPTAE